MFAVLVERELVRGGFEVRSAQNPAHRQASPAPAHRMASTSHPVSLPTRRQFLGGAAAISGLALLGRTVGAATASGTAGTATAFGSSTPDSGGAAQLESWAGVSLASRRTYFDNPPNTWNSRSGTHGTAVVSWKSGTPDQVHSWLASAPAGMKVYGCFHHEPEDNIQNGDFTYTDFLRRWSEYAPAIRAAGAIPTLILMGYTLSGWSRRNWHNYYDPASIDCLGWDVYSWGRRYRTYRDPRAMIDPMRQVAVETGKPWLVAETASPIAPGSTSQDRAAWAAALRAELNGSAQAACWWNQSKMSIDSASIRAWMGRA